MAKTKKILSLLTSLAMAASAFSAFVFPAYAEDSSQTFSPSVDTYVNMNDPDAKFADSETLAVGYNAASGTNGIKFANSGWGVNNIAYMQYDVSAADKAYTDVAEATLTLYATGTSREHTLWLGYTPDESWDATLTYNTLPEGMKVGGVENSYMSIAEQKIPKDVVTKAVYDVTDYVKADADGKLSFFIGDKAAGGATVYSNETTLTDETTGESYKPVLTLAWSDVTKYDVNINTNAYAKVVIGENTYYANANGIATIADVVDGTVLEYTVSKTGYTSVSDTLTVTEGSNSVEAVLVPEDDNIIYTENFDDTGLEEKAGLFEVNGSNIVSRLLGGKWEIGSTGNGNRTADINIYPVIDATTDGGYKIAFDLNGLYISDLGKTGDWSETINFVDTTGKTVFGISLPYNVTDKVGTSKGLIVNAGSNTASVTEDPIDAIHIEATVNNGKVSVKAGEYNVVSLDQDAETETKIKGVKVTNNKMLFVKIDNLVVSKTTETPVIPSESPSAPPVEESPSVPPIESPSAPPVEESPSVPPVESPSTSPIVPSESPSAPPIETATPAPTPTATPIVISKTGAVFEVAASDKDRDATLIEVNYNDDETMKDVKTTNVKIPAGETNVYTEGTKGSTLMLWDTLTSMTPLASKAISDSYEIIVTPKPEGEETYIDEKFDDYETGEIIKSAGNDVENAPDPVTKGDIIYAAGRRANGPMNCSSSIAEDGGSKVLSISSDGYSSNSRGVSFTFAESANIPNVSDVAAGNVLEMSFKVKASQAFTVLGFGDVTVDDLTTSTDFVNVRIILDKAASKQYIIVTDTNGTVLSTRMADLAASTFEGMTFYLGSGSFAFDNLKVEQKAKDTGFMSVTVLDGENPLEGAEITFGGAKYTTDSTGKFTFAVPNGTYDVTAQKRGYEHTEGMADADKATVAVNSDTKEVTFTLSLQSYIKLPDTVEIDGGQTFIAAPKTSEPSTSAEFKVNVLDQMGIAMNADEYGLEWEIHPQGTTDNDGNVTIANGIVAVSQGFSTENQVAAYDVVAVATANGRSNRQIETIYVSNNDIVYYETVNWDRAAGERGATMNFAASTVLPDISDVTMNVKFESPEKQRTVALVTDVGALVGLQYTSDGVITAWTGWTGNKAYNQSDDVGKFTEGKTLVTGYESGKEISVTFVIDKANKAITVSCGETSVLLNYTIEPTTLTGMVTGLYRNNGAMTVRDIVVREPDVNYLAIIGANAFAKISGQTVTRNYSLGQSVIVDGEAFEWTITAPAGGNTDGITLTDGVLSVADTATPGKYTISAVSTTNAEKAASFEVKIADFQVMEQVVVEGAHAYTAVGQTGNYEVTMARDEWDDVTSLLPAAVWTSSNTSVATIDSATGALTVTGEGSADIKATITNATAVTEKVVTITVAVYSITGEATGASTVVDTSKIIKGSTIAKYLVTTATADGVQVASTEVAAADITAGSYTVNTTGAAKYEIAPIYSANVGNPGEKGTYGSGYYFDVPSDTYNFTITASGSRADVYVNNQMLVNNILQNGGASATDQVNDIIVTEGYAKITTADYAGNNGKTDKDTLLTEVKVVKSPSIVNRMTKMYVLGDSLVAKYYNGGSDTNQTAQTGWGQVLSNYIADDIEVVCLSNSGVTASGLVGTAMTQILESAKAGDYLVLESGYNDRDERDATIMKNALREMINGAEAKGVTVVLVSPNASNHTYGANVSWTTHMEEVAEETSTAYVDLSQMSYDFFESTYGGSKPEFVGCYNVSDRLHSTYNGAQKWASFVAQGLYDLGMTNAVNTEYSYSFTDFNGNTITCAVTVG